MQENLQPLTSQQLSELQDAVPAEAVFRVVGARKITQPHPYCITPKHVQVAADFHGGILNEAAIEDAEQRGAWCDTCRHTRQRLSYREHVTSLTLFVTIPDDAPNDLNEIPGLGDYLSAVKPQAQAMDIEAFAFPKQKQWIDE